MTINQGMLSQNQTWIPEELLFLVEKCLLTKVAFLADQDTKQLDNTTVMIYISIKLMPTHLVDTNDIYQSKNINNVSLWQNTWNLPTAQKGVVNAVVVTRLCKDPNSYRELFMDNSYLALELFVILTSQYKILACRVICDNRMGWDQSYMNLPK